MNEYLRIFKVSSVEDIWGKNIENWVLQREITYGPTCFEVEVSVVVDPIYILTEMVENCFESVLVVVLGLLVMAAVVM